MSIRFSLTPAPAATSNGAAKEGQHAEEISSTVKKYADLARQQATQVVVRHPTIALATAASLGVIIGCIIKRR